MDSADGEANKNLGLRAAHALLDGICKCVVRRDDDQLPERVDLIRGAAEQQLHAAFFALHLAQDFFGHR